MTKQYDEITFKDKNQDRWDKKGEKSLKIIKTNPKNFIINPKKFSKEKADLIKIISPIKNKKILELGSGRGELSVALAKLGGIVTGVDIGKNLVELSKKIAEINNIKCKFITGNIRKLPFNNNCFDFIIGTAILHHLSDKGIVDSLNEAYRVLKLDGKAIFIEPIENNKIFNFVQNLFPIKDRPSILNRKKWKKYLYNRDDRSLSNNELIKAKGYFLKPQFKYYGLLIRLNRVLPGERFKKILKTIDLVLTHKYSLIKKLSQQIIVIYKK